MGEDEGEGEGFFWLPPFLTPPNPLNPPYQGDVPYKSPSPLTRGVRGVPLFFSPSPHPSPARGEGERPKTKTLDPRSGARMTEGGSEGEIPKTKTLDSRSGSGMTEGGGEDDRRGSGMTDWKEAFHFHPLGCRRHACMDD